MRLVESETLIIGSFFLRSQTTHLLEKVLARMKVKPGPPLSAGVETDDQIWPLLKK